MSPSEKKPQRASKPGKPGKPGKPPKPNTAPKAPRPAEPPAGERPARKRRQAAPASSASGFSRKREDHQLEQAEDYVELIESLIVELGEARTVEMGRRLGVSHVAVTRTLARLRKAGLIDTEPYRAVFLTGEGRTLAAKARARHEIVFDFLVTAGVPAEIASQDAEGIEHHVSPETLEALRRLTEKLRR